MVVMNMPEQGDIIKLEDMSFPAMVVSNHFFNTSGMIIVCPIQKNAQEGPLHIPIETDITKGILLCEQAKYCDLSTRGYSVIDHITLNDLINVSDAIQGIFEY